MFDDGVDLNFVHTWKKREDSKEKLPGITFLNFPHLSFYFCSLLKHSSSLAFYPFDCISTPMSLSLTLHLLHSSPSPWAYLSNFTQFVLASLSVSPFSFFSLLLLLEAIWSNYDHVCVWWLQWQLCQSLRNSTVTCRGGRHTHTYTHTCIMPVI